MLLHCKLEKSTYDDRGANRLFLLTFFGCTDRPIFNVVEQLYRCTFDTRWLWHSLRTWLLSNDQRQQRAS